MQNGVELDYQRFFLCGSACKFRFKAACVSIGLPQRGYGLGELAFDVSSICARLDQCSGSFSIFRFG
jgi:hypothetical protein